METNFGYGEPVQRRPRRRSRLEPILLLSFVLCLLIGSGALAAMLWLSRAEDVSAAQPMRLSINESAIMPQLTLRQLAGDPPIALAYQALEAGELETATAILSYDPQIVGNELSSLYYRLARQTAERGLEQRSVSLYETMRTIAVLDPALTATDRLQLLQLSAEGFIANNQRRNALISAQQAKRVAAQTPDVLPAQRSRYFEALLPVSEQIDDALLLQQVQEFERNPYTDIKGVSLPLKWETLGDPLPPSPEINAAVLARQQAALQVADQLMVDPQATAAAQGYQLPAQQNLANALLAEDAAKAVFFDTAVTSNNLLSLQQQLTLLKERQSWLALKLRIAERGFGIPLVPQWEEQVGTIREELAGATQNIGPVVEELIKLESSVQSKAALRVEKWQRLALWDELGLYPGSENINFEGEIKNAQIELGNQQLPLALPVIVETGADVATYRFGDSMGN